MGPDGVYGTADDIVVDAFGEQVPIVVESLLS